MLKTLYISDLDGTLLGHDAALSEESARMLRELYARGAAFTVATARTAATVCKIMKGAPPTVPAVLQNGVSVFDIRGGIFIKNEIIPTIAAVQIIDAVHLVRPGTFLYTWSPESGMKTYYEKIVNKWMADFMEERRRNYGKVFTETADFRLIPGENITYAAIIDSESAVRETEAAIASVQGINHTSYHDIYGNGNMYLEIFASTASKRQAAEFLRLKYGFDRLVGFGDNLNDLSLFEACDVKIAVGNAHEQIKAAADIVIGDNTEDSVPRFIRDDFCEN